MSFFGKVLALGSVAVAVFCVRKSMAQNRRMEKMNFERTNEHGVRVFSSFEEKERHEGEAGAAGGKALGWLVLAGIFGLIGILNLV